MNAANPNRMLPPLFLLLLGCVHPQASPESNLEQFRMDARSAATSFADQWALKDYNFLGYTLFNKVTVPASAKVREQEGLTVLRYADPDSAFKMKVLELNREGDLVGIAAYTEYNTQEGARDHCKAISSGLRNRFPNLKCSISDNSETCIVWFVPRNAYISGRTSVAVMNAQSHSVQEPNGLHPDDKLQSVMCSVSKHDGVWVALLDIRTRERDRIVSAFKARKSDAIKEELDKGSKRPD